nr:hypothetical protein CFP56_58190 [Quercus suber]
MGTWALRVGGGRRPASFALLLMQAAQQRFDFGFRSGTLSGRRLEAIVQRAAPHRDGTSGWYLRPPNHLLQRRKYVRRILVTSNARSTSKQASIPRRCTSQQIQTAMSQRRETASLTPSSSDHVPLPRTTETHPPARSQPPRPSSPS